jgi:hypothetical protein
VTGVRWTGEGFEGRCDACCEWLPLEPDSRDDFWPCKGRGLRICRACDRLKANGRVKALRESPEYRARELAYTRAYFESLSPEERRALRRTDTARLDKRRAYQREYMKRRRAA